MEEKLIGKITHYFGKISVGIIGLSDALKVGDTIHIKGHSSDFNQQISSMQVEHAEVTEAKAGDAVGIKVDQKVHEHDEVYKVIG
jgi:putative protease